jgi:hypothetical protein
MTTPTATAARKGAVMAMIPRTISRAPHRIDNVEAERAISETFFAMTGLLEKNAQNECPPAYSKNRER